MTKNLTEDPRPKMELIRRVKQEVADIHFPPDDPNPVRIHELTRTLWYQQGLLGLGMAEVMKSDAQLAAQFGSLRDAHPGVPHRRAA